MNVEKSDETSTTPFYKFLTEELDKMELKVHDIMSEEQIRLYSDDTVKVARKVMDWEGLEHACIFSHDEKLVGVISKSDLSRHSNPHTRVDRVMRKDFHKIDGYQSAQEGKTKVAHESTHCMPVTEREHIVGILDADILLSDHLITRTSPQRSVSI